MKSLTVRLHLLVADESGQDLLEYALLASIVGVASLIAYQTIPAKMGSVFSNWGVNVYNLWQPAAPIITP